MRRRTMTALGAEALVGVAVEIDDHVVVAARRAA
jgi:hypothetical protein